MNCEYGCITKSDGTHHDACPANPSPPDGPDLKPLSLWKPQSNLPWVAKKFGTDSYIWYVIQDSYGDEMCSFGATRPGEEHDEMFRQMVHLLTCMNGSREVRVNEKTYVVNWGPERIKTENLG